MGRFIDMEVKKQETSYHGRRILLIYGRKCDVYKNETSKSRRWFLTIREKYIGDYKTRGDAMCDVVKICRDEDFKNGSALHC